jgi:hypothetical protein
MAQSRPTTTTDGGKALAKTITGLDRRVRTLELREDPATGGGGGSGAWCRLENNGWANGGGIGAYARLGDSSIDEQSGGFTEVDSMTLALPEGLYVVEWSFKFIFLFTNPYTEYVGKGWTEWAGGALDVPNSVRNFTVYDEHPIAAVQFVDFGGGDAGLQTLNGEADLIVWRGIVRASGTDVNLALGILEFRDFFPSALDWSLDFNATLQAAENGGGHHNIWIASIGS